MSQGTFARHTGGMGDRQSASRDYAMGGVCGLLLLLAVGTAGGSLWSLIADDDASGIALAPVLVAIYLMLARAAWRRTIWTRSPTTGEVPRWRARNRELTHGEVMMCRFLLVGVPIITAIGALAGWWRWSFPAFLALSLALQLLLSPRQHRRQILMGRI